MENRKKVPVGLRFNEEIAEELRAAAYWTRETVTDIVETAILERLDKLRKIYNGGQPFTKKEKKNG